MSPHKVSYWVTGSTRLVDKYYFYDLGAPLEKTKVFISWSQDRSKYIAETVQWWLRQVVQASDPWVSSTDIDAGTRSMNEIEISLANTKFGIICVTPENVERPWLNYEAGALSKQVDEVATRVIPLLFDFADKADITTPVGQFHAVLADKSGFEQIAQSLNKCLAPELQRSAEDVRSAHEAFWDQLESRLNSVPAPINKIQAPSRSSDDMFREIVNTVRDLDSKIERIMFSGQEAPLLSRDKGKNFVSIEHIDARRRAKNNEVMKSEFRIRSLVRSVLPPELNPRRVSVDIIDDVITIGTYRDLTDEETESIVNRVFHELEDSRYAISFRNHGLTHIADDEVK